MSVNTNGERMQQAAREAVDLLGGIRSTARAMGVTPGAVQKWLAKRVPAERVIALEEATEARVTRYQLRPDLYPR